MEAAPMDGISHMLGGDGPAAGMRVFSQKGDDLDQPRRARAAGRGAPEWGRRADAPCLVSPAPRPAASRRINRPGASSFASFRA